MQLPIARSAKVSTCLRISDLALKVSSLYDGPSVVSSPRSTESVKRRVSVCEHRDEYHERTEEEHLRFSDFDSNPVKTKKLEFRS